MRVFYQPLSKEVLTRSYLNLRRQMLKMFTSRRDLRSGCRSLSFCYLSRLENQQPSALHNLWVLLFHVSPRRSWKHEGDVSSCVVQIPRRRTLACLSASRHSSLHFPTGTRTLRPGAAGFYITPPPLACHHPPSLSLNSATQEQSHGRLLRQRWACQRASGCIFMSPIMVELAQVSVIHILL